MSIQSRFTLRGRNPDVLACIANLSSDEVFTPPEFANRMLDTLAEAWAARHGGADIWAERNVKFLDPCTKSGVFLREIARRLVKGLADEIPDLQERVDHILTQQVYGIGMTKVTSLIARRSVYCSKDANGEHSITKQFDNDAGNIWFERTEHTWTKGKCKYCGAKAEHYNREENAETHAYAFIHTENPEAKIREIFGGEMQFDVIVGNPPYQLGQSGGAAVGGFAIPVYQKFVESAKIAEPQFMAMVTPSRWFAGGFNLDKFRNKMLDDTRIRTLMDFPNASEAFPGTQIKGGISYFLWDNSWDGPCEFSTIHGGKPASPPLKRDLRAYDILIRWNEAIPILEKVRSRNQKDGLGNLSKKVSKTKPFGMRTYFRGSDTPHGMSEPVRLIGNKQLGGDSFIEKSSVLKNVQWIEQWKVLLGNAYGAGDSLPHQIFNYPIIAEPGTACTETYIVADRFDHEATAANFAQYLRTRFVRFLVSLRKNTQHITNECFQFVPELPMDNTWTDDLLYQKYKISDNEIAYIDSMIRPMVNGDE